MKLQRRHVRIEQIKYFGKESSIIEEVEVGLIHSPQGVYAEYPDPRRDADPLSDWPGFMTIWGEWLAS